MKPFEPIPLPATPPVTTEEAARCLRIHRLNSLGSLFYFLKVPLQRERLTPHFHLMVCRSLEVTRMKKLFEMPRDHFKSTIAGEGLPIWRTLPVSQQDIDDFHAYGYSDEFIRWMLTIHDCTKRNLLISENITNAANLGRKIRRHFESNSFFRTLFPEILPTTQERWTDYSLQIRTPTGSSPHGEGTFDFLGVGSAAQSRHYNGFIIQDDLVGRKALESPSIMEKTIDYHTLVPALFDQPDATHDGDELVIGNKWGYHDLNSHIREHEPWFHVESHSALGGCCSLHPIDTPIFPEEFDARKLDKLRQGMGTYRFSCQYLNNPSAPENSDFKEEDVNWFDIASQGDPRDPANLILRHAVKDGIVRNDISLRRLRLALVADPTHSQTGRCRHAIIVLGMSGSEEKDYRQNANYYLLDTWAQKCSHEVFFNKIYELGEKWKIRHCGFETSAGQSLALPHFQYLNAVKPWPMRITELKGEVEGPDGELTTKKEWRIRNILGPIVEFGRWFMQRKQQDFLGELTTFPSGRYVDQLDCAAYAPQLLRQPMRRETAEAIKRHNRAIERQIAMPYSSGYGRA